jgi:hypothetical protein
MQRGEELPVAVESVKRVARLHIRRHQVANVRRKPRITIDPIFETIPEVFAAVAHVFTAIPHIFSAIADIFTPVPDSAVDLPVANIFAPIPDVFSSISNVLTPIADILAPVPYIFPPVRRQLWPGLPCVWGWVCPLASLSIGSRIAECNGEACSENP